MSFAPPIEHDEEDAEDKEGHPSAVDIHRSQGAKECSLPDKSKYEAKEPPTPSQAKNDDSAFRSRVREHIFPAFAYAQGSSLVSLGWTPVFHAKGYTADREVLKSEEAFINLGGPCTVSEVLRGPYRTEHLSRTGLDGVQREVLICVEIQQYKFSVVPDSHEDTSGLERHRRWKKSCEASDEADGGRLSKERLNEGDEVGCWRPLMQLDSFVAPGISCGRPVCTSADVYSCGHPDCVQLRVPAEEFKVRAKGQARWIEFCAYFLFSGFSMLLALLVAELTASRTPVCVVLGGELLFLLGLCLLLVRASMFVDPLSWSGVGVTPSLLFMCSAELVFSFLAIVSFRLMRERCKKSEAAMMDFSLFALFWLFIAFFYG